jgi:tetratricopeptide (TPR) repeat protein
VGREAELRQLHGWFEKARQGQRQVVFITGEPGIGKTTVVEAFLAQVAQEERLRMGTGSYAQTWTKLRWARATQGQWEEGLAQMRKGLSDYLATGSLVFKSWYLGLLADAYRKAGRIDKGFAILSEALAFVEQTGERYYEAELYRLKGELTLQSKQVNDKSQTSLKHVQAGLKTLAPGRGRGGRRELSELYGSLLFPPFGWI